MNTDMKQHKARIESAWCALDERHFAAAQDMAPRGLDLLTCGCLDAPDVTPAGSMHSTRTGPWPSTGFRNEDVRHLHEAREAFAAALVSEILAEEAA